MAKLIFLGEKFAGRVYEFAIEKTTVGRGDHNTLSIKDSSISYSHCEILVYGTEVIVRDLGSSNGTVVNGKRLQKEQQHPLEHGEIVQLGAIAARLDLSTEPDSDTVTGWTAVHSHARHLHDKPKPPTTIACRLAETSGEDDKRLITSHPPAIPEDKSGTERMAVPVSEESSSGKTRLILVAVAIGAVVVILCWLILVKYG